MVLAAKVVALVGFVSLFVVDVNFVSTVLFPMIVMEDRGTLPELMRFFFAHLVTVIAAALWTFCAFLSLTGTMMAVLPYRVFRRTRRYVQFVCICGLLILFLSASAMRFEIRHLLAGRPTLMEWLPSAWFLGLYQVLQGKAVGAFPQLASWAIGALLISASLAAIAYTLSYRLFFLRSAETTEGFSPAFPVPGWIFHILDRIFSRNAFDRAAFRFIFRTLARSERHTAMLAATLGLGFALAVQSAADVQFGRPVPMGLLAAPLIVIYSLLTGLRLSLGIPLDLPANWIFRVAPGREPYPPGIVRAVMLLFLLPPVILSALAYGLLYASAIGFWHVVFSISVSVLLIEILISGFRVVPFTCSWLPGRDNAIFAVAVWISGLMIFGHGMATVEAYIMLDPRRFGGFYLFLGAALHALHSLREVHEPVTWSDTRAELQLLRIGE
jgi:hypothetical protein